MKLKYSPGDKSAIPNVVGYTTIIWNDVSTPEFALARSYSQTRTVTGTCNTVSVSIVLIEGLVYITPSYPFTPISPIGLSLFYELLVNVKKSL
jgi:hypothetical protein